MPTEAQDAAPQWQIATRRLYRMQYSLEEINARIARLSIALRAPLDTDADVQRVLQLRFPLVSNERRSSQRMADDGLERRVAHKWMELRGLLVLRYALCQRLADAVGGTTLQFLLAAASDQLVREGFKRGSDGIRTGPLAAASETSASSPTPRHAVRVPVPAH